MASIEEKKDEPVPPPFDTGVASGSVTTEDNAALESSSNVNKEADVVAQSVSFNNAVQELGGVEADDITVISSVVPTSKDEEDVKTEECDFDKNPTNLYLAIHGRNWTDSVFWSVAAPREAATWMSRKDKKGTVFYRHLPLHAAITYHAPDRTIESLLRAFPQSARLCDHKGKLPIHIAIKSMCSPGTIKRLMLGYPEAVNERDVKGRTLLYLMKATMSKDREAYLGAWGAAFLTVHRSVDFDTNPSPLYTLLSKNKWDEARRRCTSFPSEASYWTLRYQADCCTLRWKMLPLHAAIIFGAPYGVVNTILKAYPLAASSKDDQGALPIHLAAKLGAHPNVFDRLIHAYPKGMDAVDSKSRQVRDYVEKHNTHWKDAHIESIERGTPYWSNYKECFFDENPTNLYRMIHKKKWEYAINLAEGYPEEAQTWVTRYETNSELRWKMLPIHAAVVFTAPLEVAKSFAKIYPPGLNCRDDLGRLPIHVALKNEVPPNVVEFLVRSFPQSLKIKDRKGRTPLALAAAANNIEFQEEYIQILSKDYPPTKLVEDPKPPPPRVRKTSNTIIQKQKQMEEAETKEDEEKEEEEEQVVSAPEPSNPVMVEENTVNETPNQTPSSNEKESLMITLAPPKISTDIEVRDDVLSVSTLGQDSYVKRTRDDVSTVTSKRESSSVVSSATTTTEKNTTTTELQKVVEAEKPVVNDKKQDFAKKGKRKSIMKRMFLKYSPNHEKKELEKADTTASSSSSSTANNNNNNNNNTTPVVATSTTRGIVVDPAEDSEMKEGAASQNQNQASSEMQTSELLSPKEDESVLSWMCGMSPEKKAIETVPLETFDNSKKQTTTGGEEMNTNSEEGVTNETEKEEKHSSSEEGDTKLEIKGDESKSDGVKSEANKDINEVTPKERSGTGGGAKEEATKPQAATVTSPALPRDNSVKATKGTTTMASMTGSLLDWMLCDASKITSSLSPALATTTKSVTPTKPTNNKNSPKASDDGQVETETSLNSSVEQMLDDKETLDAPTQSTILAESSPAHDEVTTHPDPPAANEVVSQTGVEV